MFVFEPDLRNLYEHKVTHEQFVHHTWHRLNKQECDWYSLKFWEELDNTYCDQDEESALYTVRAVEFANKIFMYCCRDTMTNDETWTAILYLPSFDQDQDEEEDPNDVLIKPSLLWFSGVE